MAMKAVDSFGDWVFCVEADGGDGMSGGIVGAAGACGRTDVGVAGCPTVKSVAGVIGGHYEDGLKDMDEYGCFFASRNLILLVLFYFG